MLLRPRVCAAIIRGNRILMVFHDHGDRSFWTLPGGGVEEGETLEEAQLGEDPELSPSEQVLKEIAWFTFEEKKNDIQVSKVIMNLGGVLCDT